MCGDTDLSGAGCGSSASPVVRPAKAGMFSEELKSPGQESEPCSLGSSVARNQDVEACRHPYL
ncbi:hypothetical protein ACM9VS_05770 [Legionella pneumophila]|uniref:hypothetical protein n=1 Tax=Legionella pneumophila TaxID=446 RepID=UPI003A4C623A